MSRPLGSKNRKPPKSHTVFAVRDLPPLTQLQIVQAEKRTGLTKGAILEQAMAEYTEARREHRNRNVIDSIPDDPVRRAAQAWVQSARPTRTLTGHPVGSAEDIEERQRRRAALRGRDE